MDSTRRSKRSSEENDDTFWKIFLNPLLNKEYTTEYDPDFEKSSKLLELERKPFNSNTSLSGSVLEKLRGQKQTVDIDREEKVRELKAKLFQMVNVSNVDSQVTDRNLQGQAQGSSANDSQTVSMEFGLTTEEGSRHEETVIISDDDTEVVTKQAKRMKTEGTQEMKEETAEAEQLNKKQTATVEKVLDLARELEKAKKVKSHQQLNASEWSITTLKIYIKRENVHLVETLVSERDAASGSGKHDDHQFSSLKNGLITHSRQLLDNHQHFSDDEEKGLRLWSLQFSEPLIKEQIVSFMVLEIIGAACELCGDVRMKPEETFEKNEFPSSRVDYALVYEGVIFGVVEVKTPNTMTNKAVAQLIIALLKLQFSHNNEEMQYIGILTDGFRFVLVSLHGEKFTFEKTKNSPLESPEINIHTAVTWENLFQLCEYLQSVLSSVTANLLKIAKKN